MGIKKYPKTNVERANEAIRRARATVARSRGSLAAPPRTGGFYGLGSRPRGTGPELKSIDVQAASGAMSTSAAAVLLNGCIPGADIANRVGRKITMQSLMIRLNFTPILNTESPLGCTARVLIVYDAQTNVTATTGALVLRTDAFLEPNNLENRDRFTVLMDKFITLGAVSYGAATSKVVGGSPQPRLLKKYMRINKDTIYNAVGGGTIADIVSGSLYLLVIASNATWAVQSNSRVRFTDT